MKEFDPKDISKDDMIKFANILEEYIYEMRRILIFPEDMDKEEVESIEEGFRRTEKLIKKLRKGNRDVLKDEDDWVSIPE